MPKTDIRRPVAVGQITAALKGAVCARGNGHDLRREFEAAAPHPIRIDKGRDPDQALPCGDLPFDDPIDRSAIEEFFSTARRNARDMPRDLRLAAQPPPSDAFCYKGFEL